MRSEKRLRLCNTSPSRLTSCAVQYYTVSHSRPIITFCHRLQWYAYIPTYIYIQLMIIIMIASNDVDECFIVTVSSSKRVCVCACAHFILCNSIYERNIRYSHSPHTKVIIITTRVHNKIYILWRLHEHNVQGVQQHLTIAITFDPFSNLFLSKL